MKASAEPPPLSVQRTRPWPPSAERHGKELSVVAVALTFLVLTVAGYVAGWETPFDAGPTTYVHWRVIGAVAKVVVWLCLLAALGWWRSSGLVRGSASPWGLVPFVAMSLVTFVSRGDPAASFWTPGLQLGLIVSIVVAAFFEEVAFRGFLLHGLTGRFGGTLGVLISSGVFAVYHVPWMLIDGLGADVMGFRLLTHFGFGVVMCRLRADTGSVLWPTAVHALWNLCVSGVAVWAYPDGHDPAAFGWIGVAIEGTGLLAAWALLFRESITRAMDEVVAGRRSGIAPASTGGLVSVAKAYGRFLLFLNKPIPATVFERFTPAARRVIVVGHEVARRQRRRATDTAHLLLGLINESDGVAATCLQTSGLARGSSGLDELLQAQTTAPKLLPFSRRARLVLRLAICEADAWGDAWIGTEHLLLATTAVRVGGAVRLLRTAGVRRKRLRRTLIALLSESAGSASDIALVPVDPVGG